MSGIAEDDGTEDAKNEADTQVATTGERDPAAAEGEEPTDADEFDPAERRCGISLGER